MSATRATVLERLFENETITLPPCDGARIFSKASEVFDGINPGLRLWGVVEAGADTPETNVSVYEICEDADFRTIFGSLSENIESLRLTQSQIIAFVELHGDKVTAENCETFFLFKRSDGDLLVARVMAIGDGFSVAIHHSGSDRCWHADEPRRVVVSQIKPFA